MGTSSAAEFAMATLVSGPIATIVTSPGASSTVRTMYSVAEICSGRFVAKPPEGGGGGSSDHHSPCTRRAYSDGSWTSGISAPLKTGISSRSAISSKRRQSTVARSTLKLPATVVIPRISSSGEFSAKISANPSSSGGSPKSVSKITLWGWARAAAAAVSETSRIEPIRHR